MHINRWIQISTMTLVISCSLFVYSFGQQNIGDSAREIVISHSIPECLTSGTPVSNSLAIFDSELANHRNNRIVIKDGNQVILDEVVLRTGDSSASQIIDISIKADTELLIEYLTADGELLKSELILIQALHVPPAILNHVSCPGEENGSISLQSSASDTYKWSTGETTSTISNLKPGHYFVSIENQNKCIQELDYKINNAPESNIDFRKIIIKCNAREEALLVSNVNRSDGYTFDWHNDGVEDWDDEELISTMPNESYVLDVKDPAGCLSSFTIDPNTLPGINFEATPVTIFSGEKLNDSWYVFNLHKALSPVHGDLDNDGLDGSVFEVSYHSSFIEAELGINELNINYYSEPKSIFARVQSPLSCYDIAEITLSAELPVDVSLNLVQKEICGDETGFVLDGGKPEGGIYRLKDCHSDEGCPQNTISYFDSIEEYVFDPSLLEEGSYTIEYLYKNENGNEFIAEDHLQVHDSNFDFIPKNTIICSGSAPVEIATVPNGQKITGQGIISETITLDGNQIDVFYFDPSTLKNGTYDINSEYILISNTSNYTCTSHKSKTLRIVEAPVVSIIPTKTELCAGEDLAISCTVTHGGSNPSYRWSGPGDFESTDDHISIDNVKADQSGIYYLEVENGLGCVIQQSVDITIREKIDINVTELKSISCFGETDGSAKVNISNPTETYTYEWDNGSKRPRANRLIAGIHTVTVTDDLGCQVDGAITLAEPEPLQAEMTITEQIVCNGASNARVSVLPSGGTGTYTVQWANGDLTTEASRLAVGKHGVTITDENSCSIEKEVVLEEPDVLSIEIMSVQHLTCFADKNGQAEINITGGTPPYTAEWANGEKGMTPNSLTSGDNMVVVTDAVGCNTGRPIHVEEPAPTNITIENTQPHLCGLAASGRATLNISGPSNYTIEWDNGERGLTATQLDDGLHHASITDLSGCLIVQDVAIELVTNMLCQSEEISAATCQNAADGIAKVEVSSGSAIATYLWDNGEQTQTATALTPGIHHVTVSDDNSCQIVCSVAIGVADPIQLACNNVVNLSLAGNCLLNFTPDLVVENYSREFNFSLKLTDESGNQVDTVDIKDYVGQTLDYVITETCKLSSCWGSINLEDKLGPKLNCSTQTIDCISHMNSHSLSSLPFHDATDFWYNDLGEIEAKRPSDCSVITMEYADDMTEKDCDNPFSHTIYRTWYATDEYDNESTCTQQINIYREEHQVVWPYDTSYVYCMTDDMDTETVPAFSPDYFGYPTLNGLDSIQLHHPSPCLTFDYVFSDHLIKVCSGSFKILREWVAIQACDGFRDSYTQTIYVKTIDFDVVQRDTTIFIETGFDCNTDMYLPITAPQFCGKVDSYAARIYGEVDMEDCKVYTEKKITTSLTVTDDNKLIIPDLEIGCNYIEVYLTTDCYESDTLSFYTTVIDYQVPVLICDAQTIVSLGSDGRGHLTVNNIDNGSWDNCGIEHMTLTKQDSICAEDSLDHASDIVSFCCEESGQTVIIIMEATDYYHNKSACKVEVFVEDGVMPYVECPDDILLACTEDLYDLKTTGEPWAEITCSPMEFYYIDSTELSQCLNEKLQRHWYTVFGRDSSFVCTQSIQLYNEYAITEDNITWPEDVEIEQCSGDISELLLGEPHVDTLGGCELIATNFIDREFETSLGSCLSILREWTIIDWCQYNENDEGIWRNSQVIKIHDKVKPIVSCEDVQVCVLDRYCEGELEMSILASDDCSAIEQLTFEYDIDLFNDGIGDIQVLDQTHLLSLNLPIGDHALTVYTTDQCGNIDHCQSKVTVSDCKAPTPYCIAQTVSTIFNDDDIVEIWATDFNLASRDNCSEDDKLQFSFDRDTLINVKHFRCEDILVNASERFELSIWVSDESGNQDACHVSINIDQNENYPCDSIDFGSAFMISGLVNDVNKQVLDDFSVSIESAFSSDQAIVIESQDGQFEMANAQKESYYEIELLKDDDFINGVTTIDMITLQNHLIGVKEIENEYKLLAADINRDGRLTTADLLLMKKMIIGHLTEFSEYETPWIFKLIASDEFSQISDSKFVTDDLYQNVHMDVVGIKIGDIDGSAQSIINKAETREMLNFEDPANSITAQVFPNPILNQATLSLSLSLENEPVNLTIMNNGGQMIWNEMLSFRAGKHTLDMSEYFQNEHAGLYYVIVHQAGVMKTLKVAKL